jgi:hypothetical protein
MYCLIVLPFLLQYLTNAKDLISSSFALTSQKIVLLRSKGQLAKAIWGGSGMKNTILRTIRNIQNTLCGRNEEFYFAKAGGTYSYHWALKGYV